MFTCVLLCGLLVLLLRPARKMRASTMAKKGFEFRLARGADVSRFVSRRPVAEAGVALDPDVLEKIHRAACAEVSSFVCTSRPIGRYS